MTLYRERLLPGPWVFIATGLVIPASLLVFLPINPDVGAYLAVALYAACAIGLVLGSPVLEVTSTQFIAGRARLPVDRVGETNEFAGGEATLERGQRLDARAWLVIRGWIDPVLKVVVSDEADPTPYWLVSTRQPKELALALAKARSEATGTPAA